MRTALQVAAILLALHMAGRPARATSYYVDPLGDDSDTGTAEAPWQTIQHAAAMLVPGDAVVVRPGIYVETVVISLSGTAEAPITYEGLSGATLESPDPNASLSAFDVREGVSNIILDGFEIRGGYHETIFVRDGATHVTIRNCDVHDNRVGVWINSANNVEIERCYIHDNKARGLRIAGRSQAVTVRNTESSSNDDQLGCLGDGDGFVVEEDASDVEFIDCLARDNSEDGFDIQGDDVRILRSQVRDNGCAGIKMSQNGRIENSVVSRNNLGITTSSYYNAETTVEIVNTTVVDNTGQQLYLKDPGGIPPARYNVVVHNVIAAGPAKAIEAASSVVLTEHHNVLFREETTHPLIVQYLADGGDRRYSGQDLNAGVWKAESGQGAGTWAISPDFADPNSYRVLPDSVAVDGGDPTDAPADDLDATGRPQGLEFDAGAYEAPEPLANHRPWADPGPPRTKMVGARVDFTAYGSADPDGDPIAYAWDFGDTSPPESGYAVSHTYLTAGRYTVTLTVSDGALARSRTAVVEVLPQPSPTPTPTETVTPTATATGTLPPTPTPTDTIAPEPSPTSIIGSPCGDAPRLGCREAARTKLILARSLIDDSIRTLRWKWLKGEETSDADLGDPVEGSTQYTLCLFSQSVTGTRLLVSAEIPPGGVCRDRPCWKARRAGGFIYRDKDRKADGVVQVVLKSGAERRAKIALAAAGSNLPLPPLPLEEDSSVTVQLLSDEGSCWQGVYPAPPAVNRDTGYRAYSRR